ncbi:MAG TPA: hypothetical protein DCX95_02710 [Elusimicrobia bacterium]|nr:hypothetical protein [Elusimicrobiota bacterium]
MENKTDFVIDGEKLRFLRANNIGLIIAGKKYTIHKMSYGDYFLEPNGWAGEERDGFAPGTLWLEKDIKKGVVEYRLKPL